MMLLIHFCPQILYCINMLKKRSLQCSCLPYRGIDFYKLQRKLCLRTMSNKKLIVISCLELKFLPLLEEHVIILVLSHE